MGLLSSIFGGNSSSSSSSTSSTTNNNQVAADNKGIAVGAGATLNYELGDEAVDVITKVLQLAEGGLSFASEQNKAANATSQAALQTVSTQLAAAADAKQPSVVAFFSTIMPYAVIAAVVFVIWMLSRKRK